METDNCKYCLFSEYTEIIIMINDMIDSDNMKCGHENSPYFKEVVNEDMSCRLFIDSIKYFKQKDRKEKLDNLRDNLKRPNL